MREKSIFETKPGAVQIKQWQLRNYMCEKIAKNEHQISEMIGMSSKLQRILRGTSTRLEAN